MRYSITYGLFLLTMSLSAQSIITDRPDQTESSSTISQGSLQIETGVLIGFTESGDNSEQQLLAPTTLFRYGITPAIELRVLSQFESVKDDFKTTTGISDLEIGTKIQVLQKDNVNTEIAFISHIILTTGSKELTLDKAGTINKLSISHELSETIGFGYNVGYDYFGTGQGNLTYSAAFGIGINNKAAVYFEPYGQFIELDIHELSFDAGVTYLIQDNFQLDFSFGTGVNHTMNYISVGASVYLAKSENSEL